jgi:sulfur relay protein TusB/DsrH
MSALHIVSKSDSALADCLNACGERAFILLIEDGVNAALLAHVRPALHRYFVLQADVDARGLNARIGAEFQRVDYAQFVQLCCDHAPIVSWY